MKMSHSLHSPVEKHNSRRLKQQQNNFDINQTEFQMYFCYICEAEAWKPQQEQSKQSNQLL